MTSREGTAMKTLLSLVGKEVAPTVYSLILHKPDALILLHSSDTETEASLLKELSTEKYGVSKCDLISIEPFALDQTESDLKAVFEKYPEIDVVNITGGTKPMALFSFLAATERSVLCEYFDSQNQFVYQRTQGKTTKSEIQIEMRVDDILALKGIDFTYAEAWMIKEYRSLTDFMVEAVFNGDKEVATIRSEAKKCIENEKIWQPTNLNAKELFINHEMQDKQVKINVTYNGKKFKFDNPFFWAQYFAGTWFEFWVYKILKKSNSFFDVKSNIKIKPNIYSEPVHPKAIKNEIDVCAVANGIPIFIECKAGVVIQDDVNKLKAVRDTYGPKYSLAVLATFQTNLNPIVLEKCSDFGIRVISGRENLERELPLLHAHAVKP
jgi:hypothetical protein